ncbi:hypothetical protein ACOMHN_043521 [Nucella lapillus]
MSDYSDFGSDDVKATVINHQDRDDVCRDFLRNTCRRGRRCKYRHPPSIAPGPPPITNGDSDTMGASSKPQPTFCHDFQNTGCHRPTCKFLHCTREEEEHFHQTGQLPHRLQPNIDVPLCRDFMKGECKRGAKCKYRHLPNDFHDCDLLQRNDIGSGRADLPHHDLRPHPNDMRNNQNHNHNHNHGFNHMEDSFEKYDRYEYSHGGPGPGLDGPQLKRRRVEVDGYGGGAAGNIDGRFGLGPVSSGRPNSYQYQVLEEENVALRRRVEELKKQVADLTATNEVLLEQNARLRVSKSATVSAVQMQASQALPPAVTLSLAGMAQPPNLQASALAAPLNTSLTQQIALNSDMATQHALHSAAQRMAREIHQQQQQQQHQQQQQQQQAVAAAAVTVPPPRPPQGAPQPPPLGLPPLTLNPTVSMNPPLASLALPQNNLVAVSLPSLVTPSSLQQVALPGCSMAQTLGPPSNPLVSYPIMSQDMRSVMAPSSLAH